MSRRYRAVWKLVQRREKKQRHAKGDRPLDGGGGRGVGSRYRVQTRGGELWAMGDRSSKAKENQAAPTG